MNTENCDESSQLARRPQDSNEYSPAPKVPTALAKQLIILDSLTLPCMLEPDEIKKRTLREHAVLSNLIAADTQAKLMPTLFQHAAPYILRVVSLLFQLNVPISLDTA